jgi:carboxyl-terminal processing protease
MKRKYFMLWVLIIQVGILQAQNLSLTERIYGISKFWQEANYNFAYFENIPDKDFDSLYIHYLDQVIEEEDLYKYYRILERFCAELKDGHTTITYPRAIWNSYCRPLIHVKRIKDEMYILNVGESYKNDIP